MTENSLKILQLKRIFPEAIRDMLQTVELTDHQECKEYALKQARAMKIDRPRKPALDLDLHEAEDKQKVRFEEEPAQEEQYSNDDWLCWMGKGT